MKGLRVVVLVSPDMSDIYFANQMLKHLNVVGIFVEQQHEATRFGRRALKALKYAARPWKLFDKIRENRIVNDHYSKTQDIDLQHFGQEAVELFSHSGCKVVHTEGKNAINDPAYVELIRNLQPDVIAVCGSSILRGKILNLAPHGVLNLHGGLSQRYRGIWTTLWAVVNEEPEYVGATVHYVSKGIDDGDIIYQGRPRIEPADNPETLYVKVVKLGVEMMIKAISDIAADKVQSYPLNKKGALYLGKMVTPEILNTAWKKIDSGVISRYLIDKDARDAKVESLMCGKFIHQGGEHVSG